MSLMHLWQLVVVLISTRTQEMVIVSKYGNGNGNGMIIIQFSRKQLQLIVLVLFVLTPSATPLAFNFSSFPSATNTNISVEGDATINIDNEQLIRLTRSAGGSVGRATYNQPFLIREAATGKLADFTTHFTFIIDSQNTTPYAEGLAFFIAPSGSLLNGTLGMASGNIGFPVVDDSTHAQTKYQYPFVAVEFDIFNNPNDPSGNHVGIDVNSLSSKVTASWSGGIEQGTLNSAWIRYNSSSKNLSVVFTDYSQSQVEMKYVFYILDLEKYLPDQVIVGFLASTNELTALHKISSWSFSSTSLLDDDHKNIISSSLLDDDQENINASSPSPNSNPNSEIDHDHESTINIGLVVGMGCGILVGVLGLCWFIVWKKREKARDIQSSDDENLTGHDLIDDNELERGTGPRKFTYAELARATGDFDEEEKLGEGGFGGVYRGFIKDLNSYVAVKRISRMSKQGLKEYAAEVSIISRLRHRNLVQLIGWCHERKLLLVYEFMPNGSLDSHLFVKEKSLLTWEARYKIAKGLASGLLYLHQEWEQCVLHRDIKSSNVMLDSNFNAKLGDFGMARLVDHGKESQTTIVAGTRGYMAAEYVTTGKASKESDVYSFGVVALEIACGRKPMEFSLGSSKINMVEWVWELYGEGRVIEAADPKLCGDFDERQMECLMIVGLWCAHPDYTFRPSIQQAIHVLDFQAPLPILPSKMPVATFSGSEIGQYESSFGKSTNSSQFTASSSTNSRPPLSIRGNISV